MSTSSWRDRFGLGAVLAVGPVLVVLLTACSNEGKPDNIPEVAKLRAKKGEVAPADHVRVVGPLGGAAVGPFDGYKRDALTGVPVADYDVLESWVVEATAVYDI